jgi:hypothetical protein
VRRGPIVRRCWEQAATIRRQKREIQRLTHGYRVANDANEQMAQQVTGWRERALALYLAADPEQRELVMRHYQTLDRLPTGGDS